MAAERLLSRRTVCDLIDVSNDTLNRLIKRGEFPPATHQVMSVDRWREDLVSAWLIVQSAEFSAFFEQLVKSKTEAAGSRRKPQEAANTDPDPGD